MSAYTILTRNGVADSGQDATLQRLAAEVRAPGAKVLLHLHGGLVTREDGEAGATRLSGSGPKSWNLDDSWTQIYVVWRTGALETIKANWEDLVHNDRLYQTVLRKLFGFILRRVGIPGAPAGSTLATSLTDLEIQRRISGAAGPRPFEQVDNLLAGTAPGTARAAFATAEPAGELALSFQGELAIDPLFQKAVADLDEALNVQSGARAARPGATAVDGEAMLSRLDSSMRTEMEPPQLAGGQRGIISSAAFIIKHAGQVVLRCIRRFRSGRDHGLHATIVEELCREFYGDRIGAAIWGMMVKDAGDHFTDDGFGTALLRILDEAEPDRLVITAHSAGSIWASHFLKQAKGRGNPRDVRLFMLAPAVRTDVFAETLRDAGELISTCRVLAMSDELERKDAVLGHDKSYIYPSSLLYLVSGMFELRDAKAYADAPLLGMQRFVSLEGLEAEEAQTAAEIATFFQQPDKGIITSPADGISMADAHGAFDDEEHTLATVRALF